MTSIRKLAAILSADVYGYSRMMGEDDRATVEALNACKDTMRALVAEHGGRVVDSPGDEMLAEFPSALEAVKAAVEIQRNFAEGNAMRPESRKMRWRTGINLGDVMEENGALYGDGVNIAARLQSLGQPGGICISGTVFDQVDGKLPIQFEAAGEQAVKNIAKPVRVYHWAQGKSATTAKLPAKAPTNSRRGLVFAAIATVAAVVAVTAWQYTRKPLTQPAAITSAADPALAMPTGPTVAVLPFVNMSGDTSQEYFSDGLTEDIITELARFKDLYVLARNTTYQYKGQAVDVPAIGKKLGAKYVLEGSVRKSADQVRITAQLIDVQSGAHVWADRYDRHLNDILLVQEEIGSKIGATIASVYGAVFRAQDELARSKPPEDLQAYDHVLRSWAALGYWESKSGYMEAKKHLERAIKLAPGYARARRDYAWVTLVGWIVRLDDASAPLEVIEENAIRAASLDPSDAAARRVAAFAHFFMKRLDAFDREATAALALSPNNPEIIASLGELYAFIGQWDRGVKLVTKAHDLNEASAGGWYYTTLFYDFFRKGQYREALQIFKQSPLQTIVESQQKYVAVYAELGDLDKAREHWQKCLDIDPNFSAKSILEILKRWNFEQSFIDRYMQSIAKAGYTVTQ